MQNSRFYRDPILGSSAKVYPRLGRLLLVWLVLFSASVDCSRAGGGLSMGPLLDTFPLTLSPGCRTEALGPLFYSEKAEEQRTWAIPPLLSRMWDPATDFNQLDLAYPLVTYRRFGTEYRWHVLQVFSFAGSQESQGETSGRFTLFPFYFQQRSTDPNSNYTAVFPIYGHLQNRLFRDDIFFVMFPIYGRSRKQDVVTDNYVYPFFHLRHGDSLRGWQLWPLAGHEHQDPVTRTNGFGDTELSAGHDETFVLWPSWMLKKSGIGTENPQWEQTLLPFYDVFRSPQRDSTTVIWPVFAHVTDRDKKYREWQIPWPLIIFARGEGKTTSRVWPLFGRAQTKYLESEFCLWPIYGYTRAHADAFDRERTRILFFLYSDTVQKNVETGEAQRRIDLWPLFTHTRDYNGNSRLQILAPLEPFLPFSPAIERNYSPVWSIWRAEKNPRTGAAHQSLLWNLYRFDTTSQSTKCSILLGLVQYQSGSQGKRLRLLSVPVLNTGPAADPHQK